MKEQPDAPVITENWKPGDVTCPKCSQPFDTHPTIEVPEDHVGPLFWCADGMGWPDRHPKWQRVEPGTVIPAGQPYARSYSAVTSGCVWEEFVWAGNITVGKGEWFIDSSWNPPLVLPTKPSVIRATVNGTGRLLYGPLGNGIDKDWCDADNGYAVLAQDIDSFEVLWTEEA